MKHRNSPLSSHLYFVLGKDAECGFEAQDDQTALALFAFLGEPDVMLVGAQGNTLCTSAEDFEDRHGSPHLLAGSAIQSHPEKLHRSLQSFGVASFEHASIDNSSEIDMTATDDELRMKRYAAGLAAAIRLRKPMPDILHLATHGKTVH